MSRDIQLAFPCPHLVIEDRTRVSPTDGVTLALRQPIAAVGLVRVIANNDMFVPSGGLFSQAKVTTGVSGPYRIRESENVLEIQTQDTRFEITLPSGRMVSTTEVATLIQNNIPESMGLTVTTHNGRIILEETNGQGFHSRILVGGSAAEDVGFIQRGARGQEIVPGWTIYSTLDDIQVPGQVRTVRKIKFIRPPKGRYFFKTTYSVELPRCPRCRGSGVENDWRFDQQGQIREVENENLLVQAGLKILLTIVRSNHFHSWYGTSFLNRIGSKAVGNTAASIHEDAQRALRHLQSLQSKQAQYQQVSAKERLHAIDSIRVFPFANDPTAFTLDAVVRNAANEPVNITIVYTAPGAVALAGSNSLSLGTEAVGVSPDFQFSG